MRAHRPARFRGVPGRAGPAPNDDPKNEFETEADLDAEEAEEAAEANQQAVPEQQAATVFTPPHPRPVFRVLRQAFREYLASGNAIHINVTTPPTHAATAPTTVAGTIEVAAPTTMPAAVTVSLTQSGATKGTQQAAVDYSTGAYTATFAANTLAVGTATASVTSANPVGTIRTPAFTLT